MNGGELYWSVMIIIFHHSLIWLTGGNLFGILLIGGDGGWHQMAYTSTNSAYSSIMDGVEIAAETLPLGGEYWLVWCKLVPLKVTTMTWRLLCNRLPTTDNLVRRNVQLSEENRRCYSCNCPEKTAQHLFLACPKAVEVWSECYSWLGVVAVQPQDIKSHFATHAGFLRGKEGKKKKIRD